MPRNTNYVWLFFTFRLYKCSNLLSRIIAIHFRHVTVHENKGKTEWVLLIHGLLDRFNSLLTVVGELCHLISLGEPEDH